MSKISKALFKYRKDHNLTSNQISNRKDPKVAKESSPLKHPTRSLDSETRIKLTPDPNQTTPILIKPSLEEGRDATPGLSKKNLKTEGGSHDQETNAPSASSAVSGSLSRFAPELVSIVNPLCFEAEMFKVLRSKILFPTAGKSPRSILVTSAVPGEGKSFIASNLAINLAYNIENHVLLVDCDVRKPVLHKLFGIGKVEGLSEQLLNGTKISSLLFKSGIEKLTILPSGKPPANPSELLSSDKMAALLEEFKSRYDNRFLIIDSPPPMIAPETTAIAQHVDRIIVVIKYGSTPLHLVEELIDNFGREKILGAVINRYDSRISFGSYGYKKYSKYYRG